MYLPENLLQQCFAHGLKCYPDEACGFISGLRDQPDSWIAVYRMLNIMNTLHEKDPEEYPRTNRDGYLIDPLSQLKLERELKVRGAAIKIIYHSHPDVGAYFSEKDREDALWNGRPRYPGVGFLVCGITKGHPDGAILAEFNADTSLFDISHIK